MSLAIPHDFPLLVRVNSSTSNVYLNSVDFGQRFAHAIDKSSMKSEQRERNYWSARAVACDWE